MKQGKMSTRYVTVCGMLISLAFVSVVLCKPIPNVSGFLSYEPKDAIIAIGGFIFGPLTCVIISVLTSLIEMLTISNTGPWGFLMNVVSTCAFTVPAAYFYRRFHSQKGAIARLALGVVVLAAVMVAWNYIVTPFYMGVERSVVAGMLATVFLPFNLVKGGLNAGITMLLYKPVVTALRKAKLVDQGSGQKGRFSLGFTLLTVAVLTTFILLLLAMIGIL